MNEFEKNQRNGFADPLFGSENYLDDSLAASKKNQRNSFDGVATISRKNQWNELDGSVAVSGKNQWNELDGSVAVSVKNQWNELDGSVAKHQGNSWPDFDDFMVVPEENQWNGSDDYPVKSILDEPKDQRNSLNSSQMAALQKNQWDDSYGVQMNEELRVSENKTDGSDGSQAMEPINQKNNLNISLAVFKKKERNGMDNYQQEEEDSFHGFYLNGRLVSTEKNHQNSFNSSQQNNYEGSDQTESLYFPRNQRNGLHGSQPQAVSAVTNNQREYSGGSKREEMLSLPQNQGNGSDDSQLEDSGGQQIFKPHVNLKKGKLSPGKIHFNLIPFNI